MDRVRCSFTCQDAVLCCAVLRGGQKVGDDTSLEPRWGERMTTWRANHHHDLAFICYGTSVYLSRPMRYETRNTREGKKDASLRFLRNCTSRRCAFSVLYRGRKKKSKPLFPLYSFHLTFDSEPTQVTMQPASSAASLAYATRLVFKSCGVRIKTQRRGGREAIGVNGAGTSRRNNIRGFLNKIILWGQESTSRC